MAAMDHWFLELQLSKLNFNDLIMQLEIIVLENCYYFRFVLT